MRKCTVVLLILILGSISARTDGIYTENYTENYTDGIYVDEGIVIEDQHDIIISGNTFQDMYQKYGVVITIKNSVNIVVDDNLFTHISSWDGYRVDIIYIIDSVNITITNNIFEDIYGKRSTGNMIYSYNSTDIIISDNIFRDADSLLSLSHITGSEDISFYNNQINNFTTDTLIYSFGTDITINNNTFDNISADTVIELIDSSDLIIRYNLFSSTVTSELLYLYRNTGILLQYNYLDSGSYLLENHNMSITDNTMYYPFIHDNSNTVIKNNTLHFDNDIDIMNNEEMMIISNDILIAGTGTGYDLYMYALITEQQYVNDTVDIWQVNSTLVDLYINEEWIGNVTGYEVISIQLRVANYTETLLIRDIYGNTLSSTIRVYYTSDVDIAVSETTVDDDRPPLLIILLINLILISSLGIFMVHNRETIRKRISGRLKR